MNSSLPTGIWALKNNYKHMKYYLRSLFLLPLFIALACTSADQTGSNETDRGSSPTFLTDKNTVLLWLFDEETYPNATITDASPYETADLWLSSSRLTEGKFGNALINTDGYNVMYAGYPGRGALSPRQPDGEPTGLWGPTFAPAKLLDALETKNLSIEFWLKTAGKPKQEAFIVDMGRGFEPGFSISIISNGDILSVRNHYQGKVNEFELPGHFYNPDRFVHLAICLDILGSGTLFIDGKQSSFSKLDKIEKSTLPDEENPRDNFENDRGWSKLSLEERKSNRFNVALLQDRGAVSHLTGALDEFRVSDTLRFTKEGFKPDTYSRNYSPNAFTTPTATGPPSLLSTNVLENYDPMGHPIQFGKRKHLFIDDKILEANSTTNVSISVKQLDIERADKTDIEKVDGEWRISFAQDGDRKLGIATANYNSSLGLVYVYETEDGVHFEGNPVNMVNYPMGGDFFLDTSPEAADNGTRYKMTAYVSGRGIYLYTSPDAVNWQRNETSVLPLLSGGSAESFYDDQQGTYVTYLKRDASFSNPEAINPEKRVSVRFETQNPYRVWPFQKMKQPYFEYAPYPSVTGEGVTQFILPHGPPGYEQVYRTRVIKYPYAPDTYLAFPWIYQSNSDDRNVGIAHSRDGNEWDIITDPHYVNKGGFREVISCQGLHRQGDELWQYMEFGQAHGRGDREWYRFRIRLDGFFALKSTSQEGIATTKTLITDGDALHVNYMAGENGNVEVEILDANDNVIPGFSKTACKQLRGDEISAPVEWENASIASLKGQRIKIRFILRDVELYAFEVL